jgi:hypothetical protein
MDVKKIEEIIRLRDGMSTLPARARALRVGSTRAAIPESSPLSQLLIALPTKEELAEKAKDASSCSFIDDISTARQQRSTLSAIASVEKLLLKLITMMVSKPVDHGQEAEYILFLRNTDEMAQHALRTIEAKERGEATGSFPETIKKRGPAMSSVTQLSQSALS